MTIQEPTPEPSGEAGPGWLESAGQWVGRYRLLEVLGEGGFGTVWLALQEKPLRREVALKILKPGLDTRQVVARFEAERQALALMDHPCIARVFDGGATEQGRPYFVMERVHGVPITEFCNGRQASLAERIDLVISVCHAVQHAHQKGIIHRDLKPSNLLVTEVDGTATPKVLDFGVAKAASRLTEQTLVTQFNQFVGTPLYMSPEQAGLGGLDVDSRSDVYSLGVLLYELLTGSVPLQQQALTGRSPEEIFRAIREQEPLRPSQFVRNLSEAERARCATERDESPKHFHERLRGGLDCILLKALERDRDRRYPTASALAADLKNFQSGEPISAVPPSLSYQLGGFARRHRQALLASAAFLIVLVVGIVATSWQALRATRLARSELVQRTAAERLAADRQQSLYVTEMAEAFKMWDLGQADRVRSVLQRLVPKKGERDLRGWEWRFMAAESRGRELAILTNSMGFSSALALSRDQPRFAVASGGQGTIAVWDAESRRRLVSRDLGNVVVDSMVFSPQSQELYVSMRRTNFLQLNATSLETSAVFHGPTRPVWGLANDPQGRHLVSIGGNYFGGLTETLLWDAASREILFRFPVSAPSSLIPQFSPSGEFLVRGLADPDRDSACSIEVWEVPRRTRLASFVAHHGTLHSAAFSPQGNQLATCGDDGLVRVWNWRQSQEIVTLASPQLSWRQVEFSPDGTRLLACAFDGSIRLWETQGWSDVASYRGHRGRVQGAHFSPDGKWILSAGGPDQTIRYWDARSHRRETLLDLSEQSFVQSAFLGDGGHYLSVRIGEDQSTTLKLWAADALESRSASPLRVERFDRPVLFACAGSLIALVVPDQREVVVQEPRSGEIRFRLSAPVRLVGTLAGSPDGRWLAGVGVDHTLAVWDLSNQQLQGVLQAPGAVGQKAGPGSGALVFSADGETLFAAHPNSREITALRWRTPGASVRWQGHEGGINSLALSRDGTTLASGAVDLSVRLWDVQTGQPKGILAVEGGGAVSLAFSSDGRTLAVGCFDGPAELWNVAAQREIVLLHRHRSLVWSVAFSPDHLRFATASYDGCTRLWTAPWIGERNLGN